MLVPLQKALLTSSAIACRSATLTEAQMLFTVACRFDARIPEAWKAFVQHVAAAGYSAGRLRSQ